MNPFFFIDKNEKLDVSDALAQTQGRDVTPIARAVIHAVLNNRPPSNAFEPGLNRSSTGLRFATTTGRGVRMPRNIKLEAPNYDFKEIDQVVAVESFVMRAFWTLISHIMPGVDSFRFEGANPESVSYIERRFDELTLPVGHSRYSFIREVVENIVRKSNAIVWLRRERDGDKYMWMGKELTSIRAMEVIDPSQIDVARDEDDNQIGFWLSTTSTDRYIANRDAKLIRYQRISKDHLFGAPFLIPVLDDILSLRRLEEMLDLALGKATFPLYHLRIGDDKHPPIVYGNNGQDTDISRARAQFEGMAPEGMFVSPAWYELDVVQPKDVGDFRSYLDWYRERIMTGLLVDGPTMGVGTTSNKDTSNKMSDALLSKIRDIQAEVASQIHLQVIRELLVEGGYDPAGPDEVFLVFKDNDAEGRMANENHILGQYTGGLLTDDEARRQCGREPMTDEDKNSKTFMAVSSKFQKDVDATKIKETAKNKTQPANQHGRSSTKPRAAKRRDSFERMKNLYIAAQDNLTARIAIESASKSLISDIIDELSQLGIFGREVVKTVENNVAKLVQDIRNEIDPTSSNARSMMDGRYFRVDVLVDSIIEKNELDNESTTA